MALFGFVNRLLMHAKEATISSKVFNRRLTESTCKLNTPNRYEAKNKSFLMVSITFHTFYYK